MDSHHMAESFTGAQYWATQNSTRPQQTTPTPAQRHLNPNMPSFQPNGNEMQRYYPPPPTPLPTSGSPPANTLQLRNLMLETHFTNTRDMAGLERRTQKNSDEIKTTQDIVSRDMRTLQSELEHLKQQMEIQKQQAGMIHARGSWAERDLTPTSDFVKNFSKEIIAKAYLEEAADYEKAAIRLREQAEQICHVVTAAKSTASKLLDVPNGVSHANTGSAFACCGHAYPSVQEMVVHVDDTHGLRMQDAKGGKNVSAGVKADGAALYVPPHRKQPLDAQQEHTVDVEGVEEETPVNGAEAMKVANEHVKIECSKPHVDAHSAEPPGARLGHTSWRPLAIRQMPATKSVAGENTETFSFDFIRNNFKGAQWSPGFYFINKNSILPSRSYWMIDGDFEPFLPPTPGQHGAKLTAFFKTTLSETDDGPDEDNYINVPLFVKCKGASGYLYYGNYSQRRFSDKLDYDHLMSHVPEEVRRHHASELASVGRPQWVTYELMKHFWPMPEYSGPIPTDSAINTPGTNATPQTGVSAPLEKNVMQGLLTYAEELKDWEKEFKMKLARVSEEMIMKSFENADSDLEPGLRLWFEYLQFEEYDEKFYNFMLQLKASPNLQGQGHDRGRNTQPKPATGGKMVKPTHGIETLRPTPAPGSTSTVKPVKPGAPRLSGQKQSKPDHDDASTIPEGIIRPEDAKSIKTAIRPSSSSKPPQHANGSKAKEQKDKGNAGQHGEKNGKAVDVWNQCDGSGEAIQPDPTTPKDRDDELRMRVAKQLQQEFKHGKKGKTTPPHLRKP